MASHIIKSTVQNTPIGTLPSTDGVMMLFSPAVAVSTTFVLNTAYLLTKYSDLLTVLGIADNYDEVNKTTLVQMVQEFYLKAGDGALLWLVGVPTNTVMATYTLSTNDVIKNLIRSTSNNDSTQRAKMLGITFMKPTDVQSTHDFPIDVTGTLASMFGLQQQMFKEGYEFSCLVAGNNMSNTVAIANLTSLAPLNYWTGSLINTGIQDNGVASVGAALGRFAVISTGHGFGATKDGSQSDTAYLTNGIDINYYNTDTLIVGDVLKVVGANVTYDSVVYTPGETVTVVFGETSFTGIGHLNNKVIGTDMNHLSGGFDGSPVDTLGSKQFMFLRKWSDKPGFYWNDGATCAESNLPNSIQEVVRTTNKLDAAVRSFFIDLMGQSGIIINTTTGMVDTGYVRTKQKQFYDNNIAPLKIAGGTGDITDGSFTMSGTPVGNFINWSYTLRVVGSFITGGATGIIENVITL